MVCGAKRLGLKNRGETTRGETTRGETSWGRNVLLPFNGPHVYHANSIKRPLPVPVLI